MTLFSGEPDIRWLFCMTHPDDEISICAWIHQLSCAGNQVWLSWTHDTPVRQEEGKRVAEKLGVPGERLRFLGAPDGLVCEHLSDLRPRFHELMLEAAPDRVVCGAFEQGHIDHDSTNWLVNKTFEGPVLEVPFYHTYLTRLPRVNRFADPIHQEVLKLSAEDQAFKKGIAKSYPSQAIWKNMMFADLRSRLFGDGSLLSTERMREQTHREFRVPNLPSPLKERVARSYTWQRWLAALERVA